jgi:hypothetical protein
MKIWSSVLKFMKPKKNHKFQEFQKSKKQINLLKKLLRKVPFLERTQLKKNNKVVVAAE